MFSFGAPIGAVESWSKGHRLGMVEANDKKATWMPVVRDLGCSHLLLCVLTVLVYNFPKSLSHVGVLGRFHRHCIRIQDIVQAGTAQFPEGTVSHRCKAKKPSWSNLHR